MAADATQAGRQVFPSSLHLLATAIVAMQTFAVCKPWCYFIFANHVSAILVGLLQDMHLLHVLYSYTAQLLAP
eukprot:g83369.t1